MVEGGKKVHAQFLLGNFVISFALLLLFLSGDISPNPDPKGKYCRILFAKFGAVRRIYECCLFRHSTMIIFCGIETFFLL